MNQVSVNGRFKAHRVTGMQRYALEICNRLEPNVRIIAPADRLKGIKGHLWEQTVLPRRAGKTLLWSPNNTGPLSSARHVITIHDLIPLEHPEWFSGLFSAWYRFLIPQLTKRALHIIAISEFTRHRIVDGLGISPDKVTVVLNGVGPEFYPRSPEKIQQAIESLHIPSSDYFLCVGSLEPRKNVSRLLQAWQSVEGQLPDSCYLVVTGATGGSRVFADAGIDMQSIQEKHRVHFTGYVSDELLPDLYSGARALVYPSVYEGFGLPPLEAMACATPVLVADTTCMPELVTEPALRFDPLSIQSIGDKLKNAASPEWRQRWAGFSKERASHFSWDRTAAATWKVIDGYR